MQHYYCSCFIEGMLVNVNSINSIYNSHAAAPGSCRPRYSGLAPLQQDTISFGALHGDLMSLKPQKIIEECIKALNDGIKIGEGQEAIAYKIENFPDYCIRREKKKGGLPCDFSLNTKLNKYDELNHVVAKLDEGTQLMRYISGIPLKITHRDTVSGREIKKTVQAHVANEFKETPFIKLIGQIEDAKELGITFDRKGENLHVDPLNQEMVCIDFSPVFHDIEYNPISYAFSALGVEKSEYAPKIFGKLCKAYAQRLLEVPVQKLNLDHLDLNFYHRGFIDDPFNEFPDKNVLDEVQERLQVLIDAKKDSSTSKDYLEFLIKDFKEYVDDYVMTVRKKTFWSCYE